MKENHLLKLKQSLSMSFQTERFPTTRNSLSLYFALRRMNKLRKDKQTNSKDNTDDGTNAFDDSDFNEDDFDQEGVYSNQNGALDTYNFKKLSYLVVKYMFILLDLGAS